MRGVGSSFGHPHSVSFPRFAWECIPGRFASEFCMGMADVRSNPNCADYGDATTRERFFLIGTRGRNKLVWPAQGFVKNHEVDMFGGRLRPWRAAREIIDWSDLGHSIFLDGAQASRLKIRRPLKANTLARIEEGVRKFCGDAAEPFIVVLRGTSKSSIKKSVRSVDMPLPTVATNGGHIGLCSPFILNQHQGGKNRGVDECLPAVTCTGAHRLVTPFIVKYYGKGGPRSVKEPIGAVTTRDRFSLVSPMGGARAWSRYSHAHAEAEGTGGGAFFSGRIPVFRWKEGRFKTNWKFGACADSAGFVREVWWAADE